MEKNGNGKHSVFGVKSVAPLCWRPHDQLPWSVVVVCHTNHFRCALLNAHAPGGRSERAPAKLVQAHTHTHTHILAPVDGSQMMGQIGQKQVPCLPFDKLMVLVRISIGPVSPICPSFASPPPAGHLIAGVTVHTCLGPVQCSAGTSCLHYRSFFLFPSFRAPGSGWQGNLDWKLE